MLVLSKKAPYGWTRYEACGSVGGAELSCDLSHAWLASETGHQEGDSVVVTVRARSAFGWSKAEPLHTTTYLSRPQPITPLEVSADEG